MDPQKPWEVPIGQPQAPPKIEPGMLEQLIAKLLGQGAPAPAPMPVPTPAPAGGPVFGGSDLDQLAELLKRQKQKAAILGGQPPPQ